MMQRLGVFWSASSLLATALVALSTIQGVSTAQAESFADWATVSGGGHHTCGVRKNGKLYCWGADNNGQVGDSGDGSPEPAPRRVGTFEDWATVTAGNDHTCGIRHGGKLYCWGDDFYGQVGDGNGVSDDGVHSPRRIGDFDDWAAVDAGYSHTCGVRKNGKLYCWGDDGSGQVGDGNNPATAASPRRIGTFEDWTSVSAGTFHTCGVRHGGKLYCWGDNTHGQLGAPAIGAATPLRIGTYADWSRVSAGADHTCGVRHGGKLYCWGSGSFGKLGNNDDSSTTVAVPQRIGSFEDWADVTTGVSHTCGVRKNGKLYCWGNDSEGQVGDGLTIDPALTPRRIGTFEDWANVSAGASHSCGVRSNGKLYCWGNDSDGQVGDGVGDSTPVKDPRRI